MMKVEWDGVAEPDAVEFGVFWIQHVVEFRDFGSPQCRGNLEHRVRLGIEPAIPYGSQLGRRRIFCPVRWQVFEIDRCDERIWNLDSNQRVRRQRLGGIEMRHHLECGQRDGARRVHRFASDARPPTSREFRALAVEGRRGVFGLYDAPDGGQL